MEDYKHERDFNPRSREGSDHLDLELSKLDGISIHAPVKGATDGTMQISSREDKFQSTLP